MKKPGLDPLFQNFSPLCDLQFVSKLTKRVVADQIQCHMIKNNLFPQLELIAFITALKAALLKVTNDLLMNMNKGHVSLALLLDLSAAFDTADNEIDYKRFRQS